MIHCALYFSSEFKHYENFVVVQHEKHICNFANLRDFA